MKRPRRPVPQLLMPRPQRKRKPPPPPAWLPLTEQLPPPPLDMQIARIEAELRRPFL